MTRRFRLAAALAAAAVLLSVPARAQSRAGQVEGFGGLTFGTTSSASTFGGGVAVGLTDHVQIIGEAGRLADIKSGLLDTALDFTPVDVTLSAWYGEGGVRFIGSPRSAVRPYAEATAGVARLRTGIDGAGRFDGLANTALAFLGTTEPLVGVGAGVLLQGGPVVLDVGYRYKKIMTGNSLASALALGTNGFDVNQVRVGLGIRF
jgi:hypothetical protein